MELITALVKFVMEEIIGIQIYYFIGIFALSLTIKIISVLLDYSEYSVDGNIPKFKKKRKKRYRQGR